MRGVTLFREREKLDKAQAKLARSQAQLANTRTLQEAEARRALKDMHREVQMEEVRKSLKPHSLVSGLIVLVLNQPPPPPPKMVGNWAGGYCSLAIT